MCCELVSKGVVLRSAAPIDLMGSSLEEYPRRVQADLEDNPVYVCLSDCYGGWYVWNCVRSYCCQKSIVGWFVSSCSRNVPLEHYVVDVGCECVSVYV